VGFDRIGQLLNKICIRQLLDEKWECNERVHELFIDFKKTYDPVRREVL
jgi:hypothetical protein